jgi:hypothetical protein
MAASSLRVVRLGCEAFVAYSQRDEPIASLANLRPNADRQLAVMMARSARAEVLNADKACAL